jgi:hypothetical protein
MTSAIVAITTTTLDQRMEQPLGSCLLFSKFGSPEGHFATFIGDGHLLSFD